MQILDRKTPPNGLPYFADTVCMYVHVCMHVCMDVHISVRTCRYSMYTCMYMRVYVLYVCVCIYVGVCGYRQAGLHLLPHGLV